MDITRSIAVQNQQLTLIPDSLLVQSNLWIELIE